MLNKRYQSYYTRSVPIVTYMVNGLSLKPEDIILEPCSGDGVFIDEILKYSFKSLDLYELDKNMSLLLTEKFKTHNNINVFSGDTLLDCKAKGYYDKIIGNPPYGAWQDYEKRNILKTLFPGMYVKETYGLFLYHCLELLKNRGLLVFIIPDTFMNLHRHMFIRKYILKKTKIREILLFPSCFFPGVNFGYGNLSIITLEKCDNETECMENRCNIVTGFKEIIQLSSDMNGLKTYNFRQKDIYKNPDSVFLLSEEPRILNLINKSDITIGHIAHCVTGFYSGNDKKFLKALSIDKKNAKKYGILDEKFISKDYMKYENILEGIDCEASYIPVIKGGNEKFFKRDAWFMNWSEEAVREYKNSKKSRFQNSAFYFKYGIAVPMVKSSSITASLIENKLFDQSIVGIFPEDKSLINYLLAFFNSPTCNILIKTINPSANNSANYIKKIPFIYPHKRDMNKINNNVSLIIENIKLKGEYDISLEMELNKIIEDLYGF